jgi:hypothetical protein
VQAARGKVQINQGVSDVRAVSQTSPSPVEETKELFLKQIPIARHVMKHLPHHLPEPHSTEWCDVETEEEDRSELMFEKIIVPRSSRLHDRA